MSATAPGSPLPQGPLLQGPAPGGAAPGGPADAAPCPRCGAPVPPGAPRCGVCALALTGPLVAALREVDEQVLALSHRRAVLLQHLAAEQHAAEEHDAGQPYPGRPGADPTPTARASAQRVLLVSGVVLLVAAAVGFAAVVFSTIGVLGQAAVLLAVCAGAAAGSRACARRSLPGSAEALAVVAVAVGVVVLVQGRAQGLLGLDAVPGATWAVVVLTAVCAACCAGAARLRTGGAPRAYGWAALAAAALLPSSLPSALDGRAPTWSAAALVLAAGCAVAFPLARGHGRALQVAVAVVGGGHLAGALVVALGLVAVRDRDVDLLAAAAQLAVLGAAAAVLVHRRPAARPHLASLARVLAWGAPAGAVLALSALGGPAGLTVLAVTLALAAAAVLLLRVAVPWPALVVAQSAAALALLLEAFATLLESGTGTAARPAAWALLAASAALTGAVRPSAASPPGQRPAWDRCPAVWVAASVAAALAGALLLPDPVPTTARVAVLLVLAAALLVLAARAARGGGTARREEVLVAGWAVASSAAWTFASSTPLLGPGAVLGPEVVLAVTGVEALAHALLPRRLTYRVVGVALLSLAWWTVLDARPDPVEPAEVWSVPPAVLALVTGALTWRRRSSASSWVVLGPGLLTGLVPSVALCLERGAGESVARPVTVLLLAAAVCALGAARSWQAPLVLGAAAGAVVALGLLGPYAVEAPLWASLGLTGALVLVLAVRLEQARRDTARAVTWVRALR